MVVDIHELLAKADEWCDCGESIYEGVHRKWTCTGEIAEQLIERRKELRALTLSKRIDN